MDEMLGRGRSLKDPIIESCVCKLRPFCIPNPIAANTSQQINGIAFPKYFEVKKCTGCCKSNLKCTAIQTKEFQISKQNKLVGIIKHSGRIESYPETIRITTDEKCVCQQQQQQQQNMTLFDSKRP